LSDGVNARGLCAALAYGGRRQVGRGFGVTTIVRYVLETCGTVDEALAVLKRVPSHMAYNITVADRHGATATAELLPGGGARVLQPAIAANHQHGTEHADRPGFTKTHERHDHLKRLIMSGIAPEELGDSFLDPPLYQRNYARGLGTLFTAVYDPLGGGLVLRWPGHDWVQRLDAFTEGRREISYGAAEVACPTNPYPTNPCPPVFELDAILNSIRPYFSPATLRELETWAESARRGSPDWAGFGRAMAMLW
jgi:predicted choloylglycine hydrolase